MLCAVSHLRQLINELLGRGGGRCVSLHPAGEQEEESGARRMGMREHHWAWVPVVPVPVPERVPELGQQPALQG